MSDARSTARDALLATFAWTQGHADFAEVLRSPVFLRSIGRALVEPLLGADVSSVIAIEARGFTLGALAARELDVGLVLARKRGGVHPEAVEELADTPDWRGRELVFRVSPLAVRPGDRLLLIDDWIETGSQARTVARLVSNLGASIVGVSCVIDHTNDETREERGLVGLLPTTELPPWIG